MAERVGRAPSLREFLEHTSRELEEIYGAARSFTELRRQAGQLATTDPGRKLFNIQGGVLKLEEQRRELLLVTLDKSGGRFSPTTRY